MLLDICYACSLGIKLEVEGNGILAALDKAQAKVCLEKALPNRPPIAVPVSTTGTTTDEIVGGKAWRQLEQWLGDYMYKLWFMSRVSEAGGQ